MGKAQAPMGRYSSLLCFCLTCCLSPCSLLSLLCWAVQLPCKAWGFQWVTGDAAALMLIIVAAWWQPSQLRQDQPSP